MDQIKSLSSIPDIKNFHDKMNKVLQKLEEQEVKLDKLNAIEIFGREGDWHTIPYSNKVNSLEVWEINEKYKKCLQKNLPNAIIKIQDSIKSILEYKLKKKFDLIVIDNPQNIFGKNNSYCEHFDCIENISTDNISTDNPIIIFNINRNPFNLDENPLWKKRREKFYKLKDASCLQIEFLLKFYKEMFEIKKWNVVFNFIINREEHLDYLVFKLKKII